MRSRFGTVRVVAIALLAAATWARRSGAQAPLDSLRPNFLYFRYASRTALALYAGYGARNAFLVFGMIENPRSDYREKAHRSKRRARRPAWQSRRGPSHSSSCGTLAPHWATCA